MSIPRSYSPPRRRRGGEQSVDKPRILHFAQGSKCLYSNNFVRDFLSSCKGGERVPVGRCREPTDTTVENAAPFTTPFFFGTFQKVRKLAAFQGVYKGAKPPCKRKNSAQTGEQAPVALWCEPTEPTGEKKPMERLLTTLCAIAMLIYWHRVLFRQAAFPPPQAGGEYTQNLRFGHSQKRQRNFPLTKAAGRGIIHNVRYVTHVI